METEKLVQLVIQTQGVSETEARRQVGLADSKLVAAALREDKYAKMREDDALLCDEANQPAHWLTPGAQVRVKASGPKPYGGKVGTLICTNGGRYKVLLFVDRETPVGEITVMGHMFQAKHLDPSPVAPAKPAPKKTH